MVTQVVPGLLIAAPDPSSVAREADGRVTKLLRDAIRVRGSATLALSGGSSPLEAYRLLATETLDWNKIHVYWVDERAVDPSDTRSNYANAKVALLDPAGIPEANIHRMRGEASDLESAAREYEASLRDTVSHKLGGIPSFDVVVLGIGDDGHTASLFPGDAAVHITDRLVAAVDATPSREARLTLTVPILESAGASVIIALGKSKHPALERVWSTCGDIDSTPARIVRGFRGSICWIIDRAAGGMT